VKAGVARSTINPPLDIPSGTWMAQKHVRGEGLDMDLWATVLVLADGDLRLAIIDFDLCFLPDELAAAIRGAVSKATGIEPRNVLPFCSHTHAGPVNFGFYRGEGEDRVRIYVDSLPHWTAGAAVRAVAALEPVRTAAGAGYSDIGINRDLPLPDGRIVVGCNPDGFCDRTVGVIRIETLAGKPVCCIVNYACHPTVLGPGNRLISPDYPGSMRRTVEQVTGATCFFLQGAAGDMGPVETFVSDAAVARNLGTRLGLEAARVFLGLDARPVRKQLRGVIASGAPLAEYEEVLVEAPEPTLDLVSEPANLPVRDKFASIYEQAPALAIEARRELERLIAAGADESEVAAALQRMVRLELRAGRMERYRRARTLAVECHAIRLGNSAIVAIAGEPYSAIGVEVRKRSPFPNTLVAGYLGGDMMYIPTAEAYQNPQVPMQVDNSPYAPEAAAQAADHLVSLLSSCQCAGK
jgi:hypothetical protein